MGAGGGMELVRPLAQAEAGQRLPAGQGVWGTDWRSCSLDVTGRGPHKYTGPGDQQLRSDGLTEERRTQRAQSPF